MLIAVALAVGAGAPQAESTDLPLTVVSSSYDAHERAAYIVVRNDGPVPIIAWEVAATWRFPDGRESRSGLARDFYEQAAGLPDAPTFNKVMARGDTYEHRLHAVGLDGQLAEAVTVRPWAVILEGNRTLGDPDVVERMLRTRRVDGDAWAEVLSRLEGARKPSRDWKSTFDRTKAALEPLRSENNERGSVALRLLYRIRNAERDGEDEQAVFAELVERAKAPVDAARRFGTLAADPPAPVTRP